MARNPSLPWMGAFDTRKASNAATVEHWRRRCIGRATVALGEVLTTLVSLSSLSEIGRRQGFGGVGPGSFGKVAHQR